MVCAMYPRTCGRENTDGGIFLACAEAGFSAVPAPAPFVVVARCAVRTGQTVYLPNPRKSRRVTIDKKYWYSGLMGKRQPCLRAAARARQQIK